MNERVEALVDLEPPPGGLAALRERLDRPRRPWIAPILVATTVAAVLLAWVLVRTAVPPEPPLALGPPIPPEPAIVLPGAEDRVAMERVAAPVVWYRVSGTVVVPDRLE